MLQVYAASCIYTIPTTALNLKFPLPSLNREWYVGEMPLPILSSIPSLNILR